MSDISTELLFLLLIGAYLLFQYLLDRHRASKRRQERPPEAVSQAPEAQASGTQWDWVVPERTPEAVPSQAAAIAPPPRIAREQAPPVRRRSRFSRAALMGDKRKLQDAVVIAAIMGPCRAMQPHETPR